ncbi:MAG: DUF1868 domain-containing protein [bacterium]|nr:DUF1868 domain-containing protein [bacterium]
MNQPAFTFHVGEKFYADGSPRQYPGVTVICFADPASAIYKAGESIQAQLLEQPFGHKFALLPPSSFHMTVFSLICTERRSPDQWSAGLPLDATVEAADQFFIDRMHDIPAPPNFRMCITYLGGRGLTIRLNPADEGTYETLWAYRDQVSQATGVRYPDHDRYLFHLTLAYNLIQLTDAEDHAFYQWRVGVGEALRCATGIFETGQPVLTFFDDMFRFVPAAERLNLVSRQRYNG